jgi:Fe-S cluster biogenesis protein NfuA
MEDRLREARDEINEAAAFKPRPEDVRAALDVLRPGLLADGGNLELMSIEEDGTVRLELQGACVDCPAQQMTLRLVIEPYLKEQFRGVTSVLAA